MAGEDLHAGEAQLVVEIIVMTGKEVRQVNGEVVSGMRKRRTYTNLNLHLNISIYV